MNYFYILGVVLFLYMTSWFVLSLIKKRNDVADVAWGLGFVLLSWLSLYITKTYSYRSLVVCSLVTVWGLRLAWHIYRRNKGKSEDYRYKQWREDWGEWFYLRSYFQVYLLQGFLLYLIVTPVLIINKYSATNLNILDLVALVVWLIGFTFESVGDAQLAEFIKNPENKGKLMRSGLWQYTRHPNYFGEVMQWWGIWLFAMSVPNGMYGIIGPLTITILILKISGIPLLEKKMEENPDFVDYKSKTSMFLPWFKK
jgi:steroid 5-alpha reductase family enzyme